MKSEHEILYGEGRIVFRLRRANRQTLAITVLPDLGVAVTAPKKATLESVVAKVRMRARWIRRQQTFFRAYLPQTPPRRYLSGETHRYLGRQYRLKVEVGEKTEVKMKGRYIWVTTPDKRNTGRVRKQVERWFVVRARTRLERSYTESITRIGTLMKKPPPMRLRRMAKRWGSWTRRGGVWLNPELVKAPGSCIDYVVTHELCHVVHGHHGKEFYALLRRVMPDWEKRKERLETIMAN